MQMIIIKIGCRIGQSRKIRSNMLVCTSIREPSRGRNRTNSKMGRGLVMTAAKLSTLRCCVIEGEAQLTLDMLLKRSVRRPLSTSSRSSALLPVRGSRGIRAMKIRPAMVVVPVVVGAPTAAGTTSVTTKIGAGLLLCKMSRGQQR